MNVHANGVTPMGCHLHTNILELTTVAVVDFNKNFIDFVKYLFGPNCSSIFLVYSAITLLKREIAHLILGTLKLVIFLNDYSINNHMTAAVIFFIFNTSISEKHEKKERGSDKFRFK